MDLDEPDDDDDPDDVWDVSFLSEERCIMSLPLVHAATDDYGRDCEREVATGITIETMIHIDTDSGEICIDISLR